MGLTEAPVVASPDRASAAASAQPVIEAGSGVEGLLAVERWMGDCRRCGLCDGRTNLVYGEGNPAADLMFIGAAPSAEEDQIGRPFFGASGELLTRMIEQGMQRPRRSVFIANIVKCRPPGDRQPKPDEIASCLPFLLAQIAAVSPKVIVLLGDLALKGFRPDLPGIIHSRGQWIELGGIPTMPTFHPTFLLREAEAKRAAWMDLKKVMERLA
jgi:uracil-DNA glycosylase family 4